MCLCDRDPDSVCPLAALTKMIRSTGYLALLLASGWLGVLDPGGWVLGSAWIFIHVHAGGRGDGQRDRGQL